MASRRPATPRRSVTDRRVAGARASIENLRPHELAAELQATSDADAPLVALVDVRGPDEHASGAIDGSVNVPRGTIEGALDAHVERDRRIVLYCDSGDRSALAAARLYELGYTDVAHLDGGLDAWRDAGLPISPRRADPLGSPTTRWD